MKFNYMLGIGIVLSLVGASLLLAFGFLYLRPYIDVQNFKATRCTTVHMSPGLNPWYTFVPCQCAADGSSVCESRYPCIWVRVNFTDIDSDEVIRNVTLYDSYETYFLQHDAAQCSYHKCNRIEAVNSESTRNFFLRHNTNSSYSCYYNPDIRSFAIVDVVTLPTVINCMFWPCLAFIIGIVIFLVQVFHVDAKKSSSANKNQMSSLERQWARIRERSYGRMTSTGSERLVKRRESREQVTIRSAYRIRRSVKPTGNFSANFVRCCTRRGSRAGDM